MKKLLLLAGLICFTSPARISCQTWQELTANSFAQLGQVDKKTYIIGGAGATIALIGAYSMKKSVDIFSESAQPKQSVLLWIKRHVNATIAGGFGLSSFLLGAYIAAIAPQIADHLSRHYTKPS